MRQVLVDDARRQFAGKRAPPAAQAEFELLSKTVSAEDLIALDDALKKLGTWDARQGRIVEMLFFGDLTEEEAVEVLGVSTRTVKRDWQAARAWLHGQMGEGSRSPFQRGPSAEEMNLYFRGTDQLRAGEYFAATKALGQACRVAPGFSMAHGAPGGGVDGTGATRKGRSGDAAGAAERTEFAGAARGRTAVSGCRGP